FTCYFNGSDVQMSTGYTLATGQRGHRFSRNGAVRLFSRVRMQYVYIRLYIDMFCMIGFSRSEWRRGLLLGREIAHLLPLRTRRRAREQSEQRLREGPLARPAPLSARRRLATRHRCVLVGV